MKLSLVAILAGAVAILAAYETAEPRSSVALVRVPNGGIQAQVIAAEDGTLHLLYFSGDPKHGDLFYVKSSDYGSKWSAPIRANSTAGSAIAVGTIRGGQLAMGRNGRIHVAWNGSSPSNAAPMLYSRLKADGTAFEPERNLMTRTFGLDGGGSVAADSSGNVYVAWHGKTAGAAEGEAGRQVWIAVSHNDGATFDAEKPAWQEPTGACGCCGMALFAARDGAIRALYRSATENVHRDIFLLTSFDHARSFEGRRLHPWEINACPMSSMAFAEGAGMVAGAWETGGQVYFENLTKSNAVPVSGPGEGKGRKHPRIAITPNGEILTVWTEGTGWQRGGSLAWQMFDSTGKAIGAMHTQAGVPAWSFAAVVAKPGGFVIVY